MAEDNTLAAYGSKLEKLGKMFQNPKTKLQDLVKEAFALGLTISFRIEPVSAKEATNAETLQG